MNLVFCAYDRPNHLATGPNVWLKRFIPSLVENKIDVLLLFIYQGDVQDCPTINFFNSIGYKIATLDSKKFPYVEQQIKWIIKIVGEYMPDVLIANLVVPAFYAKKYMKGIPVIGTLHSNDKFYKSVIRNFVAPDSKIKLDGIVAVSNYIKLQVQNLLPPEAIVRIPCGTPMLPNKTSYEGGLMKIMYAGRLVEEQKQISKLTHAFCKAAILIPNTEFSIYGDGPQLDEIKKIVDLYKVGERVKILGPVDSKDMHKIMAHHHIFTLMSDYEGMPVALVEAMSCGMVPVCLSEESGINEVVENGVNGFIVNDRDESYIHAIKQLQQNPELWAKLSTQAITTIDNDYSSDINNRRWITFLQNFVSTEKKKVRIPHQINISKFAPLFNSEIRKPNFQVVFIKGLRIWFVNFRSFLRPRARIRNLLSKIKILLIFF